MQAQSSPALKKSCPSAIRQQISVSSVSAMAGLSPKKRDSNGDSMVRQLNHHDQFNILLRANRTVVLAVLWVALAACVVGSVIYDVADWIGAW